MLPRLTGTLLGLVLLCLALPPIAHAVQPLVGPLLSVLVLLAIVRLARPPSRPRR